MRLHGWLTGCFVLLGLAFRTCHYLRMPSVWHDEAALLINVIGKRFGELLGPLFFAEAAPPLFLWVERGVALVLGDDPGTMRLVPFLASCASLLLVAWTAWRILNPAAVPWAVLLFAASDRILWHGCEAKPYAVDMLVCASVIALFVGLRVWPLTRQLLVFTALAPVMIFISYPACFVLGGLLVVLLLPVIRERRVGPWAAYGLLTLVVFGAFGALTLGPVRAQRAVAMDSCWVHQFPPWEHPWRVPGWVLFSTLDVFRYCFEPAGPVLAFIGLAGGIFLWRARQRAMVVLAVLPLGLALAASFLGAYPYGGARVEVYAAPGLALLIAAGVPPVAAWLRSHLRHADYALAVVLLIAPALAAHRVVVPWRRPDAGAAAAYTLQHRQAEDMVTGNMWPYDYYFRGLGSTYLPSGDFLKQSPHQRMWLVITAWPTAMRDQAIKTVAGRRPILDRQEFIDTTVVLLGPD